MDLIILREDVKVSTFSSVKTWNSCLDIVRNAALIISFAKCHDVGANVILKQAVD